MGLLTQDHEPDIAREADVARGTCADATRHARPRGRAARAHTGPRWRGHMAGATRVHAGAWGGATWQSGAGR